MLDATRIIGHVPGVWHLYARYIDASGTNAAPWSPTIPHFVEKRLVCRVFVSLGFRSVGTLLPHENYQ